MNLVIGIILILVGFNSLALVHILKWIYEPDPEDRDERETEDSLKKEE